MAMATAAKLIRVFVRKGVHNEQRIISFTRPDDVTVKELFDHGIALDGSQATFAVTGVRGPHDTWEFVGPFQSETECYSLPMALQEAEEGLMKFLESRGYSVVFA